MEDDIYGQTVVPVSRQYDAQLKPLGDLALAKLAPSDGEFVLDIGCGAAQTCLQLAKAVGPSGAVLGVDRSPVLAKFAAERTRSMPHIQIVRGDAQTYTFKPNTYHALFSRFGVMAFANPVAAFSNLRRALKPEGRLAFVCWRGFRENELDYLPFDAAADHLPEDQVQTVENAYPFSFSDPDYVRSILRDAGFGSIGLFAHDISVCAGDLNDTLELCLSAGALGGLVRKTPQLRDVVLSPVCKALAARQSVSGLFMNAAVRTITAKVQ